MTKVYIIAEAGVNHNGCLDIAKNLIDVAWKSGADAVKFQTFKAENNISRQAPKAEYQLKNTSANESQFEMVKRLELDLKAHEILIEHTQSKKIDFLSTAFDLEGLNLLTKDLGLKTIKISSGDLHNAPLLLEAARRNCNIILSTGMSSIQDIEISLGILGFGYLNKNQTPTYSMFKDYSFCKEAKKILYDKVTLLHCTTEYPAPLDEANLLAINTLRQHFELEIGLSDHTLGIIAPITAAALGVTVIEKHFTLDKNLPGPDHKASLTPQELIEMVDSVRKVSKLLGTSEKKVTSSEVKNLIVARKSLIAAKKIIKGEVFTSENLTIKRPGSGVSPLFYWDYLNKIVTKDYSKDELIAEL